MVEAKYGFEARYQFIAEIEARISAMAFCFEGFLFVISMANKGNRGLGWRGRTYLQEQKPSGDSDCEKEAGNNIWESKWEFFEKGAVAE